MTVIELTDGSGRWFDRDTARVFDISPARQHLRTKNGAWVRHDIRGVSALDTWNLVSWSEVRRDLELAGKTKEVSMVAWPDTSELEI